MSFRYPSVLLPLSFLIASSAVLAQRRVEVSGTDDRDLVRAAHRLGVSVERIKQGRQVLRRISDLVPDMVGEEPVAPLAGAWMRLERRRAAAEIKQILAELRDRAARSRDRKAYDLATGDARAVSVALKLAAGEEGGDFLSDWPEPPAGTTASGGSETPRRSSLEVRRRFERLSDSDPDAALELLPQLEQGGPDAGLRGRLMWSLAKYGRVDEANRMLDELVTRMASMAAEERSLLQGILYYASQFNSERMPEIFSLWAEYVRSRTSPQAEGIELGDGTLLTQSEYRILQTLSQVARYAPQAVDLSLDRVPEIRRKLEEWGGISGFMRQTIENRSLRQSEQAQTRQRLASGPDNYLGDDFMSDRQIQQEIQRLLGVGREKYESENYTSGSEVIDVALRLVERMESRVLQLHSYQTLASMYIGFEGQLSDELISLGWDSLAAAAKEAREGPVNGRDGEIPVFAAEEVIRRTEIWLLAALLWTDFDAGNKKWAQFDEPTRFAAGLKFLVWLTEEHQTVHRAFR